MEEPQIYKGIDLLNKIIEFTGMTPDSREWNQSSLKDNPPRLIRFKQIQALIKAFFEGENDNSLVDKVKSWISGDNGDNNKLTIQSVLSGDFLKGKWREDYSELLALIAERVKERETEIYDTEPDRPFVHLIMSYQHLVGYKSILLSY